MTTIAVSNGNQMSCDGSVTGGFNRKETRKNKIFSHKGELWGFAGLIHDKETWVKWIDGSDKVEPLDLSNMPKESIIMRLNKEGITVFDSEDYKQEIENNFAAIGSGWRFAIGALEYGASSAEAVSIAAAYDEGSGGSITTVKLGDKI